MVRMTARAASVRPLSQRMPVDAGPPAARTSQAVSSMIVKARLPGQDLLHGAGVGLAVGLGPGTPDRGAFAPVEEAVLDGRAVGDAGHLAAEGVDLADDLALGQAADGRVARHGGNRVGPQGDQGGGGPEACRRQGGLAPGVPAAYYNNIEGVLAHLQRPLPCVIFIPLP